MYCVVDKFITLSGSGSSTPVLIGGPGFGRLFCGGANTTREKKTNPSFRQGIHGTLNNIYNFKNFDWVVNCWDTLFLPFPSVQNHCKKSVIVLLMQTPCRGATGGSGLRVTGSLAPVGPPIEPPLLSGPSLGENINAWMCVCVCIYMCVNIKWTTCWLVAWSCAFQCWSSYHSVSLSSAFQHSRCDHCPLNICTTVKLINH